MVGDPGTGKSTILTSLCDGNAQFESGNSFGSGLTDRLHSVVYNGKRYSDTPGMNDITMKEAAAAAIAAAVLKGGRVKLVFVLTLEAGRVRASNLATVRVVLEALHEKEIATDGCFGVIINKMTQSEQDLWKCHADEVMNMLRRHIGLSSSPDRVLYVQRAERIVGATNARLPTEQTNRVKEFVSNVQTISVAPGTAITVKVEQLEELIEQITAQFRNMLAEEAAKLNAEFQDHMERALQSRSDAEAVRATYEEKMERLRQRYTLGGFARRILGRIASVPLPHLHLGGDGF